MILIRAYRRALAVLPQNTRGMPFEEVKKINQTYTLKALEQIEQARAAKGEKGTFRFLYISGPDTPRTPDGPTPPVFREYIRLKVRASFHPLSRLYPLLWIRC